MNNLSILRESEKSLTLIEDSIKNGLYTGNCKRALKLIKLKRAQIRFERLKTLGEKDGK